MSGSQDTVPPRGLLGRIRGLFADTRPLRQPDFRRLWTANIITVIGAQLTVVAVPAQIYSLTGSSAYVGLTGLFGLVPLVFFGLWGGALADAMDRRKLLILTTVGLIVTSGLFWAQAALHLNSVWLVLVLFAIQQAFFAVNQPTRTAILPKLIPHEQLPAANSLNMTVMAFGAIAGPLVGGALIPVLGYPWLYGIDTILLFATLYAVVKLPALVPDKGAGDVARKVPGFGSVIDGLAYLRFHHILLMSFVLDLIAMIFGMPRALFPQMAHESFGGPADGGLMFALLYAAIPAGSVVGGVFSGWVSRVRRHGLAVIGSVLVWGVGIAGFGVAAGLADGQLGTAAVIGLMFLVGAGAADMTSMAFRQTILQTAATDELRGRIQGVFTVVVVGGPRLADVLHGWAGAAFGTTVTTAGGGLLVIVGVLICALAVPSFTRYRATPSPEDVD